MKTPLKNVRLTISVTPDVHLAFQRMAKASRISISRAMGDWLSDTVEAADFMSETMERAKAMPRSMTGEIIGASKALRDADSLLRKVGLYEVEQAPRAASGASRSASVPAGSRSPRPVIRGGKSHE